MKHRLLATALAVWLCAFALPRASAEILRIATMTPPTLDPHFLLLDSNLAYNFHIYEALTGFDRSGNLIPGLATGWTLLSPTVWRFSLREGVYFHDGSAFTADDVVYSFERVRSLPNNPAPYTSMRSGVIEVRKVDELTLDIVTSAPNPLLPRQVFGLLIVSRLASQGKTTKDFNDGSAAIGTGPYRYTGGSIGESLRLERNEAYWGERPAWERVHFAVMPNAPSRIAALLAGDIDLTEQLAPHDAAWLRKKQGVSVFSGPTARVAYLNPNAGASRDALMADARVRAAVSLAIDRELLVDRMLDGFGTVVGQIAVPGMLGRVPELDAPAGDVEQAKEEARALLAQAGYPQGTRASMLCPRGRYINDVQVCLALAQMLTQVGIEVSVEALPPNVFFSRVRPGVNPADLSLLAWANSVGDSTTTLRALLHSYSPDAGLGPSNSSGLEDEELDRLIVAAGSQMEPADREALLQAAMRRAMARSLLIPLYAQNAIYAARSSIDYEIGYAGDADRISALKARPVKGGGGRLRSGASAASAP